VKDAGVGIAITVLVTAALWQIWGDVALVPALTFGSLATAIHVAASALLQSALDESFGRAMSRWAMGMGLRLIGVALFAAAVILMRDRFPPAPSAIAYLGVLLPLMGLEMNLLRKRL
jgi:hypothetical protein